MEKGTYAVEAFVTDPKTYPNWDSIDIVMHEDAAGTPHLYSSKPPLLATLYAGVYWIINRTTGATLGTHPYEIDRALLLIVNVLPLMVYFLVIASIVERYGRSDWGSIFVMATATFGTFLTTFAVVLNNHVPAAVCAAITLDAMLRIWYDDERRLRWFALAGFFGALMAACELPALSFFCLVAAAVAWKAPRQTILAFLPAALVIVVPFFATNWIAHHSLSPPYAHRELETAPQNQASQTTGKLQANYFEDKFTTDSGQTVTLRGNRDNWYDYEFTRTDGEKTESYWRNPKGVDIGEPSIDKYVLHLLVGHHGIFSLTPIWLLAIPGIVWLGWGKDYRLRTAAISIMLLSIVCIAFYILRPQPERNYGGMSSGFRWAFWLAPLWLFAMLPAIDRMANRRWARLLACLLLGLSALSAAFPVWTPFTEPWLATFWQYMG